MATATSRGSVVERAVEASCWLARFSDRACVGQLRKVHLVSKHAISRRGFDPWDPRSWVAACGGPPEAHGLGGHHGLFDSYRLVVPAEELPEELVEMATEFGMLGYLFRRYGLE